MKNHVFKTSFELPLAIDEVFDFFSDATNLEKITPPELQFNIRSPGPIVIQQGTQIDYRLKLWGIPFSWRTEITCWEPPVKFIDEQINGPYHTWMHTHRFIDLKGSTRVEDAVRHRLPFWPMAEVAYPIIRAQINRIFTFREEAIKKLLVS